MYWITLHALVCYLKEKQPVPLLLGSLLLCFRLSKSETWYSWSACSSFSIVLFLTWSFRGNSLLVMSNYMLIRSRSFRFPNRDLVHERLRSATKSSASEANGIVHAKANGTTTDVFRQLWRVEIVPPAVQFMKGFYLQTRRLYLMYH